MRQKFSMQNFRACGKELMECGGSNLTLMFLRRLNPETLTQVKGQILPGSQFLFFFSKLVLTSGFN
jgi:hypothetical protein